MQILDNLFGSNLDNLSKAMDRTTLRHSLLTGNLANVNTPGYKRKDVDFGITLQDAQNALNQNQDPPITTDQTSNRLDGNSVDLEKEVMSISETELRYQALTDMTARYFSNLKNVIKEGK